LRVLGIDPGTRFTGYGVVEQRGPQLAHVGHGVIRLDPRASLEQRLDAIFRGLRSAAELYRPDEVAVEGVFTFKNARSALVLGHARGVALLVAAQRELPVHEYPPAQVKKSVGAGGASDKDGVSRMVRAFLAIPDLDQRADASDALAVAICHLNHARRGVGPRARGGSRRSAARAFAALADRLRPASHRPMLRRLAEDSE
jgi:crossover junction endodeoxyribonuclease RuvC